MNLIKKKVRSSLLGTLHSIGLTQGELESPIITDEPKLPNYICLPKGELSYESKGSYGQGFDTNEVNARIKSVAECLERICLFNPKQEKLTVQKFDCGRGMIDPANFLAYSKSQIDLEKFKREMHSSTISWWPAMDIFKNKEVKVPAQMLFLSSYFNSEVDIRMERISTGAAFGKIGEGRALSSGFFEVIERDSVMGAYLMKKEIAQITNLPKDIQKIIDYYRRYNLETCVFDITCDLEIPTVMSIVLDRTGIGEAVNLGAKSNSTYQNAIIGSLFEAIQPRRASRMAHIVDPKKFKFDDTNEIRGMEERYAYWRGLDKINYLDFWLNSPLRVDFNLLSGKRMPINKALKIIKERGYSVYVSDITLPEINEKGFETLKVLIPELHPLYLAENAKSLYSVHYGEIKEDPQLKPHPFT